MAIFFGQAVSASTCSFISVHEWLFESWQRNEASDSWIKVYYEARELDDSGHNHPGLFPTTYGLQCSFALGGTLDDVNGPPAIQAGNNSIAQILHQSAGCYPNSYLLYVDCESQEMVFLESNVADFGFGPGVVPDEYKSTSEPVVVPFARYDVGVHLDPNGPIDIHASGGMADVIETASSENVQVHSGLAAEALIDELFGADEFDPYCGCRVHFPNSAGARQ